MRCALAFMVLVGAVAPASADRQADARKLFDDGRLQYQAKDYDTAAIKFDAAYALDADPAYLYNAGAAHLKAKHCADAVDRFTRYLAEDPPNRDKVEADLAEAKACAPKKDKPEEPERPIPPPPLPPQRSLIAPVSLGVAGAALIVVGAVFTSKVSAAERDRAAVCPTGCTWDDDKDAAARDATDRGERNSKIAIASYVVGGLAIAGGVAVYIGSKPKQRERAITIAPNKNGGLVIGQLRF